MLRHALTRPLRHAGLAAVTVALALGACSDDDSSPAPAGPGAFVADYRGGGGFFSLMEGFEDGQSPHGLSHIWYSDNLAGLVGKASFKAPVGSVAIKEFDNDDAVGVDGLAVMIKEAAGYDAANGDWRYEMRTVDGAVMQDGGTPMSGPIAMCVGCHAASRATDYLAGVKLTGGVDLAGPGAFPGEAEEANGFFTLMSGPVASDSPHGTNQIWYSDNIRHLVHQSAFEVPVGTVSFKKFDMNEDGDFDGYAVMVKEAGGYDAAHGDWRYEMRGLDGAVMPGDDGAPMSGPIAMCTGCHAASSRTDYLSGLKLR